MRAISRSQRSPFSRRRVLVVVKFLAGLDGKFRVRPFDDGIDRASFLAEAAVDAFDHVDVVAGGAARAVVAARTSLDRDRLSRADRFAELAGDTALLAVRIASLRVFAPIARRLRILLVRIIERRLRLEESSASRERKRRRIRIGKPLWRPDRASFSIVLASQSHDRAHCPMPAPQPVN